MGPSDDKYDSTFELVGKKPLGKGGFGATWRAKVIDQQWATYYGASEVALKIPHGTSEEISLQDESKINGAIFSRLEGIVASNLVRFLGVGNFQGRLVMVMEFIPGGSLRDYFRTSRVKPLPFSEIVEITRGMLRGLKVLHSQGVMHRDLKPDNVLLMDGVPKLADFGLSRVLRGSEAFVSGQKGTKQYWSPEMWENEGVCFASDLWAVGVTVYEMVCGSRPFDNYQSEKKMIDMICNGQFTPAPELRADIPLHINEIINRALSKDPGQRFKSADEMLVALDSDDVVSLKLASIRARFETDSQTDIEDALRNLAAEYPKDPRVYCCLGEFYNKLERFSDALRAYESSVACDDSDATAHYYLGMAYQLAKRLDKAITALERARSLGLKPKFEQAAKVSLGILKRNSLA